MDDKKYVVFDHITVAIFATNQDNRFGVRLEYRPEGTAKVQSGVEKMADIDNE